MKRLLTQASRAAQPASCDAKHLLTVAARNSSAAHPASSDADTRDAGGRRAEQPTEQNRNPKQKPKAKTSKQVNEKQKPKRAPEKNQ